MQKTSNLWIFVKRGSGGTDGHDNTLFWVPCAHSPRLGCRRVIPASAPLPAVFHPIPRFGESLFGRSGSSKACEYPKIPPEGKCDSGRDRSIREKGISRCRQKCALMLAGDVITSNICSPDLVKCASKYHTPGTCERSSQRSKSRKRPARVSAKIYCVVDQTT